MKFDRRTMLRALPAGIAAAVAAVTGRAAAAPPEPKCKLPPPFVPLPRAKVGEWVHSVREVGGTKVHCLTAVLRRVDTEAIATLVGRCNRTEFVGIEAHGLLFWGTEAEICWDYDAGKLTKLWRVEHQFAERSAECLAFEKRIRGGIFEEGNFNRLVPGSGSLTSRKAKMVMIG